MLLLTRLNKTMGSCYCLESQSKWQISEEEAVLASMYSTVQGLARMEEVHQLGEAVVMGLDHLRDETQGPQPSDKQRLLNLVVSKSLRSLAAV